MINYFRLGFIFFIISIILFFKFKNKYGKKRAINRIKLPRYGV